MMHHLIGFTGVSYCTQENRRPLIVIMWKKTWWNLMEKNKSPMSNHLSWSHNVMKCRYKKICRKCTFWSSLTISIMIHIQWCWHCHLHLCLLKQPLHHKETFIVWESLYSFLMHVGVIHTHLPFRKIFIYKSAAWKTNVKRYRSGT